MKNKKLFTLFGILGLSALAFTACKGTSNGDDNSTNNEENSTSKNIETITNPLESSYNPETDIPVAVYGPPETFGLEPVSDETEENTTTKNEPSTIESYDPETDFPVDVYGPPEMFE